MAEPSLAPVLPEEFEFAALSQARNYRDALLRNFSAHLCGRVLEVGAGIGQITAGLLANRAITRVVSVEPRPTFASRLRASFPGHSVVQGTIDDLPADDDWNVLISINVLEHIGDDARELAGYHRRLAGEAGTLCLFVPARPEIYAPIDRDFGHFRRYTKPELRGKLERAGFEILQLRYYNLAGYVAWWLNFCLLKRRHFGPAAVRFFDRWVFPPTHALESRVGPPFIGQSLLATARPR